MSIDAKILLYYKFTPIADPEAVKLWQKHLPTALIYEAVF